MSPKMREEKAQSEMGQGRQEGWSWDSHRLLSGVDIALHRAAAGVIAPFLESSRSTLPPEEPVPGKEIPSQPSSRLSGIHCVDEIAGEPSLGL